MMPSLHTTTSRPFPVFFAVFRSCHFILRPSMLPRSYFRALASSLPRSVPKLFVRPPRAPLQSHPFSITLPAMATEFKLKELSKLDLNNGDKVEAEVEGIEGGKVLLVKVQDKIHALNANCTHFGAPLKNGILTPEGRLTCPWHGGMLAAQENQATWIAEYLQLASTSQLEMSKTPQRQIT